MRSLVDAVDRFAEACGWSSGDVLAVQVSLDELLSNVLKYGGAPGAGAGSTTIALVSDSAAIRVVVEDAGLAFDPLSGPRSPQARTRGGVEVGGRGLVMVQRLMDGIHYARSGETNRVTMLRQRRSGREDRGLHE